MKKYFSFTVKKEENTGQVANPLIYKDLRGVRMLGQRRTKRNCFNGRPFGNRVIRLLYLACIGEALDAVPPGGGLR
jgi:hypothetical protein